MIPPHLLPLRALLVCITVACLWAGGLSAQAVSRFDGSQGSFYPQWLPDTKVTSRTDLDHMLDAPAFAGAHYDERLPNLPFYELVVPVGAKEVLQVGEVSVEGEESAFSNAFQRSWAESGLRAADDAYPAAHVVLAERVQVAGQHRQHVRLYPLRVGADGGRVTRVRAVHYRLTRTAARAGGGDPSAARTYKASSALASGTWFKLGITQAGVYQLDYNYLQQIGANPASINPNTLRIHGNGGAALPQVAGAFPYDDLEENAIFVQGGTDGRFDQGDYVLFYAPGTATLGYHPGYDQLYHDRHPWSDTAYYFLSWGGAPGKRIGSTPSEATFTHTASSTRRLVWHEDDHLNLIKSGRTWVGETFDLTTRQTFTIATPQALSTEPARITVRAVARSLAPSSMVVRVDGAAVATLPLRAITASNQEVRHHVPGTVTATLPPQALQNGEVRVELEYVKQQSTAVGHLDYIEIDYAAALRTEGRPNVRFDLLPSPTVGRIDHLVLGGMDASYRVWDVSDPVAVSAQQGQLLGSNFEFNAAPGTGGRHWIAFKGGFLRPLSAQRVGNQNLHALPQADYLIVTPAAFLGAAERLAAHHRQKGLSVHVVQLHHILNEFGSGAKDLSAVRDFVKMFYDRAAAGAGTPPRYLLLVGDGSHDPKGISHPASADHVPTYQSRLSHSKTESYTSDDYLGFLDDGEGYWGEDAAQRGDQVNERHFLLRGDTVVQTHGLDIAIGRLPVENPAEADAFVEKIIQYESDPQGFGAWRNRVILVADFLEEEGPIHLVQADGYSTQIAQANPCINVDKYFMDNYQLVAQASANRFPDGREAMLKAMDEGGLIVNYTGHGGEIAWSNATILDISDIKRMANGRRLPLYVTATCQFGRWDDPGRRSGAEGLVLQEGGGAIAMLTTVRTVYSGPNLTLNRNFYQFAFRYDSTEARMPTLGEIFMRTKNASWLNGINNRNFSLLGDPALTLAYPELRARITTVNGQAVDGIRIDTLGALTLVSLAGEVTDAQGQLQSGFNGDVAVTVLDKPMQFITKRSGFRFFWQKNRIFNGSATVTNGRFNVQFVVPVDISYESGLGKISLYVQSAQQDGAGCHSRIHPGGSGGNAVQDDQGPELTLYMNDEKFVDGGMVGTDPVLLADVFDDHGLNTVGTGIGHELTAVLDGDDRHIHVLNDAYTAARNSYQQGRITYPLKDLAPGPHSLDVKVWDVANNSATGTVEFVVADDASMALGHVLNYPNPFTTHTKFIVEHNRNGSQLKLQVRIYTVSGRLIKTLEDSFYADGNLHCELEWDGLDEYGDALGRGVYVYQVRLEDETRGGMSHRFEKLVVLR